MTNSTEISVFELELHADIILLNKENNRYVTENTRAATVSLVLLISGSIFWLNKLQGPQWQQHDTPLAYISMLLLLCGAISYFSVQEESARKIKELDNKIQYLKSELSFIEAHRDVQVGTETVQ